MHCKNCLAPLSNGDTYCKVCGKPVEPHPSNEEIIKAYNEPNASEPKPAKVGTSQMMEQTNVLRPVKENSEARSTASDRGSDVLAKLDSIRPEPLPIVNKKEGISKKIFVLGILIAIVVTAIIVCLICIPVISNRVQKNQSQMKEEIPETQIIKEERTLFSGYSFLIPEEFSYKITGNQLIIENIASKEAIAIQVTTDTYNNLKGNLTALKTNLTTSKWTVGKIYVDQIVKNRSYLTVEATSNEKKLMIAYTSASTNQVFGIVYLNPSSIDYPTTSIETFNDIIDSAEKMEVSPTTTITAHTTKKIFFEAN